MSLFSFCRSGIYQLEIVSFCAIFYSNTNSIQLFCVNSSLNSGNFTNRLIFVIMSWKFDPRANIFYPNVICDFCDKFHVCLFVPLSHVFHVAYVISFYQVFFIFHWYNAAVGNSCSYAQNAATQGRSPSFEASLKDREGRRGCCSSRLAASCKESQQPVVPCWAVSTSLVSVCASGELSALDSQHPSVR